MDNPVTIDTASGVALELPSIVRIYKDGSIQRLDRAGYFPPSPNDPSVASRDVVISPTNGLQARLFLPVDPPPNTTGKLPILLYFHGGGFCTESALSPTYHSHVRCLSARASILIASVHYRLAPEHPIPAAYDDSWAALRWAREAADEWISAHGDLSRVFLAGDSAGGNIVHNVALRAGVEGAPVEGLVLVHPFFWGTERMESEEAAEGTSLLSVSIVDKVWACACGRVAVAAAGNDDPRINPFVEGAPPLEGLGCERVMVCVAGKDLLRDRGRAYFEALRRSGKWGGDKLEILESEGEEHVFHLFKPECQKAKEMMDRMVEFFRSG